MGTIARTIANSIKTDGTLDSDASNSVNFRNLIINGAMQVWQRGTSSTAVGSSNTYHADRFLAREDTDGGLTTERSTESPDNFKYSTKVTVTSADTSLGATQKAYFSQRLEGTVWEHLNFGTSAAQTVTLSFYVRSSLTGTFSGSLINDNNNRAYPWEYTINSADTWERKTITIPGDTTGTWDTGSGDWMELYWDLGLGSNFEGTAGAWAAAQNFGTSGSVKLIGTNSATWYITGIQLEIGTTASDFEFLPYDVNLRRCQRYFQVFGSTGGFEGIATVCVGSSTSSFAQLTYLNSMRTSPSVSFANLVITDRTSADHTVNSIDNVHSGLSSLAMRCVTSSGFSARDAACLTAKNTGSGYLRLDSEL